MGNYSIPEEIRKQKPTGSVVKLIGGNYYVYEQKHIKDENTGKWKIKSGKYLGKITKENGYIPVEDSYFSEEDSVLDFGNYAFAYLAGKSFQEEIESVFDKETASKLYVLSIFHLLNGFSYTYEISNLFDQSFFKIIYPGFKFGETALRNLYSTLGRKRESVEKFQKKLYEKSNKIAIDGHCIPSSSNENDLSRKGNKAKKFINNQVNLVMGYAIDTGAPVFAEVVQGDTLDSVSVSTIFESKEFKNTLFIVDKGFFSGENLKMFTKNGCHYIIPPKENTDIYSSFMERVDYLKNHFIYKTKTNKSVIYYDYEKTEEGNYIYSFRDLSEHEIKCDDYRTKLAAGKKGYTQEKYEKAEKTFGTITVICDYEMNPEDVFNAYKKRWSIETFYNYLKNRLGFEALHCQDYYIEQGLSFIILLTSNLHYELTKKLMFHESNLDHVLLDLKAIRLRNNNGVWQTTASSKKRLSTYSDLGLDLKGLLKHTNEMFKATKN